MTILLSDPRVAAVPVRERGEPLVALGDDPASETWVRAGVAARLRTARELLPDGIGLHVIEGHRSRASQQAIVGWYGDQVRRDHPALGEWELRALTSRFVSPVDVAPHPAGAAVDLTLVDDDGGQALDMGTPVDATPERSNGACYFDAPGISRTARRHRTVLARAMRGAGFVNYPTEWWHWSYGDRYWALVTGAPAARYGPVDRRPDLGPFVGAAEVTP